jgi:hypothetical protein
MSLIKLEYAIEILKLHIPRITNCLIKGIEDYKSLPITQSMFYEKWTKASIIRDNIVRHVKADFQGIENTKFFYNDKLFILQIGEFYIRFNKFNEEYNLVSKKNKRSRLFVEQQELFPKLNFTTTNLIAGYQTDEFGEIASYAISLPNGNTSYWFITLPLKMDNIIIEDNIENMESNEFKTIDNNVRIKSDLIKKAIGYEK